MSDILERARSGGQWICGRWIWFTDDDRREAADEIERLREENEALRAQLDHMVITQAIATDEQTGDGND